MSKHVTQGLVNGKARVSDPPEEKSPYVQHAMVISRKVSKRFSKIIDAFEHEPDEFMSCLLDICDNHPKELEKIHSAFLEKQRRQEEDEWDAKDKMGK